MILTEKQAFKVLDRILTWANPSDDIDGEMKADFVMMELVNLELGSE